MPAESRDRYYVPDLIPPSPRVVFVAESPHTNEVEPDREDDRRPLCGAAGKVWWAMLGELLEGAAVTDLTRPNLLAFCRRHHLAVINAVQYPLDPAIVKTFPQANPVRTLGFSKLAGETSYKKLKGSGAVARELAHLRERLTRGPLARLPVYSLGNDAEWFVTRALGEDAAARVAGKIPHPSAWWRAGGEFRRTARERLSGILR